jgi:putative acetyltransferase
MIKKAEIENYPEIQLVWESSVKATHDFLPEDYFQEIRTLFQTFLPAVDLYVDLDETGTITGFLGVADGKIEMLFLHPNYIGAGIGRSFTRFAIDQLQVTKVDVNEQNEKAVKFYQRMGFRIVKRNETDGLGRPFPILEMVL